MKHEALIIKGQEKEMNQKQIVIVDDNAEFRKSAQWWLEAADYHVKSFGSPMLALSHLVDKLGDGRSASDIVQQICILLDVRMPEMSGMDLHDALRNKGFNPPVIYMTGHGEVPLAVEAMKKGAVTFLEKPFDDTLLKSALDIAFSEKFSSNYPGVMNKSYKENGESESLEMDEKKSIYQQRFAKLTRREREVLTGIVDGKMNKVIADKLNISIKTVEVHRSRLIRKLEAKTLPQMIKMVITGRVE